MKSHEDLMKQRRRWINSSMFAFEHVQANYQYNVSLSSHNFWDKYVKLNLAMLIAQVSMVTTYISPSIIFYILFTTILQIDIAQEGAFIAARIISVYFVLVYLVGVAGSLMGNAWIQYARYISFFMIPIVYGLLGLVTYNIVQVYLDLGGNGVDVNDFYQMSVVVMVFINLGLFFLIVLLNGFIHPKEAFKLLLNTPSYISYQAAYTITMIIHAFCNVDDVSWGTKGASGHGGTKKYEG
jgi:chitin synthase